MLKLLVYFFWPDSHEDCQSLEENANWASASPLNTFLFSALNQYFKAYLAARKRPLTWQHFFDTYVQDKNQASHSSHCSSLSLGDAAMLGCWDAPWLCSGVHRRPHCPTLGPGAFFRTVGCLCALGSCLDWHLLLFLACVHLLGVFICLIDWLFWSVGLSEFYPFELWRPFWICS